MVVELLTCCVCRQTVSVFGGRSLAFIVVIVVVVVIRKLVCYFVEVESGSLD